MINFIHYHLCLVILFTLLINRINCRQAQLVQQISQCSNEEYFNVNLLKCIKCEQTFDHPPDQDYQGYNILISSKVFNQGFSSNSVLDNQNFSFNSHQAASSSNNLQQFQSNLERSSDGLSCVCRKGSFRFKKRNSKFINEMICLPCPAQMVSSLNRNTCSFCEKIPSFGRENIDQFRDDQTEQQTSKQVSKEECGPCGENEILVERQINSTELVNLNRTALHVKYNYGYEFNLTHSDRLLTVQICTKCPSQTRSINNQCKICHFSFDNCDCSPDKSLIVSNGVCLVKNSKFNQDFFFKINYTVEESNGLDDEQDKESFKISSYIKINFHSSFSQCYYYHNITACEQFANLCVLNHYRYTFKTSADLNTACDLYLDLYVNKKMPTNYLPQIYFTKEDTKDENTKDYLFKIQKNIQYKLNERVRLFYVSFNANGEFKESRELYLDELLICSSKDQSMDSIVRFAVNVEFKCNIKLNRLFKSAPINSEDQLFYELYLLLNHTSSNQTTTTNRTRFIYPIYILNRNLVKNDQLVNRIDYILDYFNFYMDHSNYFSDMINRWQLVKRFFMIEQLTSKESTEKANLAESGNDLFRNEQSYDESSAKDFNQYGNTLRYVNRMKLMIRSNPENPNQIYPPLLILDYNQVTKRQLKKYPDQTVQIQMDIQFEMNELNSHKKLTIFLAVFCSLTVLLALFRTYAWAKRSNHDNTLNLAILFKFVLFNCDYLANVFFILVLLLSVHSFLIYKFQSVVYCFLPSKSLEYFIQQYIILAFSLKSVSILHEFWIRSDIDIFFIDWEKSRSTKLASTSINLSKLNNFNNFTSNGKEEVHEQISNNSESDNHLYKYLNQRNLNGNQTVPNGNIENLQQKLIQNQKLDESDQFIKSSQLVNQFNQNAKYIDQYPEVSIWRTLFVANEYCELCTYRRVSISYHLFILLIVLQCCGIENFAKADLKMSFDLKEDQKYVASSFTGRFVIGALTFLLTVLINWSFTKYYLEPFVCDKISEFVDFCSVSNVSIFCLMYEKFGYYVHGKSATGRSELNMPQMHHNLLMEEEDLCSKRGLLSNSDVQCFQMLLNDKLVVNYKKIRALLKQKTQNGLRVALHKVQNVQKIWYSYYLMNKLLSGFIDHMFVEMDYIVKERSPFEMLLDAELSDVQMLDKSVFFLDKFHSFENVLFVGLEIDVIFYELMFFTLIDLLTYNYIIAIALTFILNQILERTFIAMAKKNLIAKSLVDERFLL